MMGLLRSEWIKLRSVRSTYLTFGLTVLISVGAGAAIAASVGTAVKDGTIRTSLTAVPRRGRFLAAKVAVFALVTLAVSEATTFCCFFTAQSLLAPNAGHATLGQPHVARAVIGAGIYLTLIGLLGLALGSLLRHAAPAIAIIVALLFIPYEATDALPAWFPKYLPTLAGAQISNAIPARNALPAWAGLGLMAALTATVLTAALIRLCATDA
jgi:hypothetical protein